MAIEVSRHAIKRYVERINGPDSKEEIEINRYITLNSDMVRDKILKIYEHAKLIYRGQIGTDKITSNFFIRDDIILVVDANLTKIITLYRVDFDFPPETNRTIVKDLVAAIEEQQELYKQAQVIMHEMNEATKHEMDKCNIEIKNLEEQLLIKRNQKKNMQDTLDSNQGGVRLISSRIENYANKLCNSLEFKKDINAGFGK